MATRSRTRVRGLNKVLSNLRKLNKVRRDEVASRMGTAMGLALMEKAVPEAPFISGTLRRSGTVDPTKDGAIAGMGVEYAHRVHEGFSGQDKLGRTFNQPGNPYLIRGARQARQNMKEEAAQVARDEFKKHTKR